MFCILGHAQQAAEEAAAEQTATPPGDGWSEARSLEASSASSHPPAILQAPEDSMLPPRPANARARVRLGCSAAADKIGATAVNDEPAAERDTEKEELRLHMQREREMRQEAEGRQDEERRRYEEHLAEMRRHLDGKDRQLKELLDAAAAFKAARESQLAERLDALELSTEEVMSKLALLEVAGNKAWHRAVREQLALQEALQEVAAFVPALEESVACLQQQVQDANKAAQEMRAQLISCDTGCAEAEDARLEQDSDTRNNGMAALAETKAAAQLQEQLVSERAANATMAELLVGCKQVCCLGCLLGAELPGGQQTLAGEQTKSTPAEAHEERAAASPDDVRQQYEQLLAAVTRWVARPGAISSDLKAEVAKSVLRAASSKYLR